MELFVPLSVFRAQDKFQQTKFWSMAQNSV